MWDKMDMLDKAFYFLLALILGLSVSVGVLLYQKSKLKNEVVNWKIKYTETMSDLSFCHANHAETGYKYGRCTDSLYDLREWLRWCKPKCEAKKSFNKILKSRKI